MSISSYTYRRNIGQYCLGALVLDKTGQVTQIKSLHYDETTIDKLGCGPQYYGTINGNPVEQFEDCPLTRRLLKTLGWAIDPNEPLGYTTAWPPQKQLPEKDDWKKFPVRFNLRDEATKGFPAGSIVIILPGTSSFNNLTTMAELDRFFMLEFYTRMPITLPNYPIQMTPLP